MATGSKTLQVWANLDALAALLEDPKAAEDLINKLEADLVRQSKPERDVTRRKMIYVVACLSRLEARMMTAEGPLGNHQSNR
jgi:ABC-type hemin transport system substrate-binding protein